MEVVFFFLSSDFFFLRILRKKSEPREFFPSVVLYLFCKIPFLDVTKYVLVCSLDDIMLL